MSLLADIILAGLILFTMLGLFQLAGEGLFGPARLQSPAAGVTSSPKHRA